MANQESDEKQKTAMEATWEQSVVPALRDILKWEHDQLRPRNEALEKWGPMIEDEILRELERERRKIQPRNAAKMSMPAEQPKDSPDMDMDR